MIHFIRHGQSEFNAIYDVTGCDPNLPDPHLSAKGQTQVRAAAQTMGRGAYDLIVSSPYTRALQTASLVAEVVGAPIVIEPLVGERRLYSCDIGTPVTQLSCAWPHLDFSAMTTESWWIPFDESHADLMKRVAAFESRWMVQDKRVLIASHYYFIHAATGVGPANAEIVSGKKNTCGRPCCS